MPDVDTPESEPAMPPEFFANAIAQLRRHWVNAAAVSQGIDPSDVRRALVIGNTAEAEVRINENAAALAYLGDDQIVDLDIALEHPALHTSFRGLLVDVAPDLPYSFFDLDLRYLKFDFQPGRDRARRHPETANEFWRAATVVVRSGGVGAACGNMFAAAELATMALIESSDATAMGHSRRSKWLEANGPALGLTESEWSCLTKLLSARNVYRYGDEMSTVTPVELLKLHPAVGAVLKTAAAEVAAHAP